MHHCLAKELSPDLGVRKCHHLRASVRACLGCPTVYVHWLLLFSGQLIGVPLCQTSCPLRTVHYLMTPPFTLFFASFSGIGFCLSTDYLLLTIILSKHFYRIRIVKFQAIWKTCKKKNITLHVNVLKELENRKIISVFMI